MKTDKIKVNKTPQQPDGIEIELIQPENPMEERLLSFLIQPFLVNLKRENRIPYDLPARFEVQHRGSGTFLATGYFESGTYYEPPRPIAIVGLRVAGNGFDLIHADANPKPAGAAVAPATTQPAAAALPPASETPQQNQ